MRGATFTASGSFSAGIFQSTRHAPRAGRDCTMSLGTSTATRNFNPRAPCGARLKKKLFSPVTVEFQSTRPMRGATTCPCSLSLRDRHFNPRAPCGARLGHTTNRKRDGVFQSTRPMRGATLQEGKQAYGSNISIHAPHAGRDHLRRGKDQPLRAISIHAPHAGRDERREAHDARRRRISIHAPHAGRDSETETSTRGFFRFQSTRPMRGATRG